MIRNYKHITQMLAAHAFPKVVAAVLGEFTRQLNLFKGPLVKEQFHMEIQAVGIFIQMPKRGRQKVQRQIKLFLASIKTIGLDEHWPAISVEQVDTGIFIYCPEEIREAVLVLMRTLYPADVRKENEDVIRVRRSEKGLSFTCGPRTRSLDKIVLSTPGPISRALMKSFFEDCLTVVHEGLKEVGDEVKLQGFGTFSVHHHRASQMNLTGEVVKIPPRNFIHFRPSMDKRRELKDIKKETA